MSSDTSQNAAMGRRTFLKASAGLAGVAAAGASASAPATAQSSGSAFDGWFDNVSNYGGVVDKTGSSEVTIEVGAKGNNGNFAFGPAAVRVDPGTKVVWKWTGKGGSHNVVAEDGSFESETVGEEGHTFSQKFDAKGIVKYACTPHKPMGMKGAVVVGTEAASSAKSASSSSSGSSDSSQSGESGQSGSSGSEGFGDWFSNVSNYEGVVDKTGSSEVTIEVGAKGNNGNFAFSPAAVRVDPGTKVVWKWTGKGVSHNVVAEDGSFKSKMTGEQGHTFSQTLDEEGITKYACSPHKAMGMKGAVVVGTEAASSAPTASAASGGSGILGMTNEDLLAIGASGALVAALLGLPVSEMRSRRKEAQR